MSSKHEAPPTDDVRVPSFPTLASLCKDVISSKIERYPPESLGILSESEWDAIVRLRHKKTAPKQGQGGHGCAAGQMACTGNVIKNSVTSKTGGIDGTGRLVPAISAPVIKSIEEACEHLKDSSVADDLVWKDCVEYKFRTGGPSRPKAFQYPWNILVKRLTRSGDELLDLLKPPDPRGSSGAVAAAAVTADVDADADAVDDDAAGKEPSSAVMSALLQKRNRILDWSIRVMSDAPMSVPLLTASGVGKAVQKFVKNCAKLRGQDGEIPPYMVDVWVRRKIEGINPVPAGPGQSRIFETSALEKLERMLQGWKNVASSSGVAVSAGGGNNVEDCSGRDKKTSAEQHERDMKTLQRCKQWRHVYDALVERETTMMESRGKRMREIRENLNTDRPKISKITFKAAKTRDRREAILNGARGVRAMTAAASASASRGMLSTSGPPGESKMSQLRRETAIVVSRQVPVGVEKKLPPQAAGPRSHGFGFTVANAKTMQRKTAAGSFGASVASASVSSGGAASSGSKRPMTSGQRSVALGAGKKMKLPHKTTGGVFSSIERKKERSEKSEHRGGRDVGRGQAKSYRR